jgi:hypothetical protein
VVAAIENAGFGSYPGLIIREPQSEIEISEQANNDPDDISSIKWTAEAEQCLPDAPKFARSQIRRNAEKKAEELGIREITQSFIENQRK